MKFEWVFDIDLSRDKLWRYVSDTNRMNRLTGLFPVHYEYTAQPSGGSEVHASATVAGIYRLRWTEHATEWAEPHYFQIARDYDNGPFMALIYRVELRESSKEGSTQVRTHIDITPRHFLGSWAARLVFGFVAKRKTQAVYALAPAWATGGGYPLLGTESSRAGPRQRREILRILGSLARELDATEITDKLQHTLLTQPDSELHGLEPYVLADLWDADRRRVLEVFLHATKRGLFDLEYNFICPSCRQPQEEVGALLELNEASHCNTCNISFGVDFDRAVEVRFTPRPLGLGLDHATYCHSGPANTPHRVAAWPIGAGESRTFALPSAGGVHQLTCPQTGGAVFTTLSLDPSESLVEVELSDEGITGVPADLPTGAGELVVRNGLSCDAELIVSRTEWADTSVSAAEVTALREFRDLFGSEILAPGAEFSIRNLVFLFTDLVGSTAMYERIGDAPAFGLVRDHFDLMMSALADHDGTLVKTIGDAVMAVFRHPDDGLRAALAMQERIGAVEDPAGSALRLRIGLNQGPCIAMNANNQVDYFGTTVNLAARVQSLAEGGEIALSPDVAGHPAVVDLLRDAGPTRECEVELKGLRGTHKLTVLVDTDGQSDN